MRLELVTWNRNLTNRSKAERLLREAIDLAQEEGPDYAQWQMLGGGSGQGLVGGRVERALLPEQQQMLRAQAYSFYYTNPHARGIIRTLVKFVFGRGVTVHFKVPKKESEIINVEDYWKQWSKINKWELKHREMGIRSFRDGECFNYNRNIGRGKVPELQILDPDMIESPDPRAGDGIEVNEDGKLVSYRVQSDNPAKRERIISAADIVHIKLNVDSNVKRGRTTLEPVMQYLRMYHDWVKDRMVLNKVRSSVALVREVDGTSAQIEEIRNRRKAVTTQSSNKQKMLQPGSILTPGPGVKYNMLAPNINASDAKDDGKNILLAVAAGIGFPEMFLTADYSNANYSSTLIAQNPLVREFEDWQDFFDVYIQDEIQGVLSIGKMNSDLEELETEIEIEWPPLIHRNLKELADVLSMLFQARAVSKETMDKELGYSYKEEIDKIDTEEQANPPEAAPAARVAIATKQAAPPARPGAIAASASAELGRRKRVILNEPIAA